MSRPIVTVAQGKLQGIFEENVLGHQSRYLSFKGIPFASPPVGTLRFKDPEAPAPWEGIRDASKEAGDICAQMELSTAQVLGSEDCLYLNVYIPYNIYLTSRNPVMVWIHGGTYYMGSGSDTHKRSDYLMAKDVILVSINYRLGAFGKIIASKKKLVKNFYHISAEDIGFLNLDHEAASGNQGLKDQVAALKWIKENIDAFGGDPNNITIFGVSAGSFCAHFLTLSPLSKGLFHKAILQSGAITCGFAYFKNQPEATSFKLASILGNDSKNPEKVVEFLQTIPTAEIVKAQHKVLHLEQSRVPFRPTIDDKAKRPFLPSSISFDDDNNIPIMIGYTSHEYIMLIKDTEESTLKTLYENLPRYVELLMNSQDLKDEKKIMQLTERIKQKYFHNKSFTEENIQSIIRCMSDIFFNIPINDFVDKRRKRKQASTYFYKFSYVGNEMTETRLMSSHKVTKIGASHTDDMSYLFYIPKCKIKNPRPPIIGTKDRKMVEILTRMWTNFAKTGNPTPALDQYITTIWSPATADSFNYLDIGDSLQLLTITDYNDILEESEL